MTETPRHSKRLKTSKEKESQDIAEDIDLKALQELKKSLICSICKRFPRPKVYTCKLCENIVCSYCWNEPEGPFDFKNEPDLAKKLFCKSCVQKCGDGEYDCKNMNGISHTLHATYSKQYGSKPGTVSTYFHTYCGSHGTRNRNKDFGLADPILSKFVSLFKHPCQNGCEEKFDAKELQDHEKSCFFRIIKCPDLHCSEEIRFGPTFLHYNTVHANNTNAHENLEFKGTIEELRKKKVILKRYKQLFFPQFYVNGNLLHFWMIGHCLEEKANTFEASISFFYNGKWNQSMRDTVKPIDMNKDLLKSGEYGLVFPVKTITQYFDYQTKISKNSDKIEFKLEVVCEKRETR